PSRRSVSAVAVIPVIAAQTNKQRKKFRTKLPLNSSSRIMPFTARILRQPHTTQSNHGPISSATTPGFTLHHARRHGRVARGAASIVEDRAPTGHGGCA